MTDRFSFEPANEYELIALFVLALAVPFDVRELRIPNWITFPVMAIGICLNTIASGRLGLVHSASGLLLGVALFLIPVVCWGRGAGDLKLLAALGALGGPAFAVWTALLAGVAGGILAIGVLRSQQKLGLVVAGMASGAVSRNVPFATSNIKIPYAVAIAAGALVALVVT